MDAFIEEKKFRIKIIHIISIILALVFLFTIYGLTMTNYKYHRKLFGNRYTYTAIEKKNMPNKFDTFVKILSSSNHQSNEEFVAMIDKDLISYSFRGIMNIYLEYLPADVNFTDGNFSDSQRGTHIKADEYTFQIKGEDLQNMIIEVLNLVRNDSNFYYLSQELNTYPQLDRMQEISNENEFKDYLDEKIDEYSNADFVGNNYQWYQTNFVNKSGDIFFRLLVFSRMEEGTGKTMVYYNGGYLNEEGNFQYEFRFTEREEEVKVLGNYTVLRKEISGEGKIYKDGEYLTEFSF